MLKVTLKCQKYESLYHFLEIYEYMNVGNGQNSVIFSNLFVINIHNSVVQGY